MGKHRTKNRNRTHQKNKLNSKLKKHSSQRKKSTKKRGTKKKRGGARGLKALARAAALSAALASSQMTPVGARTSKDANNSWIDGVVPHDPYAPNNGLKQISYFTSSSRQPQYAAMTDRHHSTSVIRDKSPKIPSYWAGKTRVEINFMERNKERKVIRLREDIAREWENAHNPGISVEKRKSSKKLLNKLIETAKEYKHDPLAWNWEPTLTQWRMAYDLGADYLEPSEREYDELKYAWVPLEKAFTHDHNRMEDKFLSLGALVESIENGDTPHSHPSFADYYIWREGWFGGDTTILP